MVCQLKNPGNPGAIRPAANRVRGGAAAEKQPQGIHDDRFAAAGFPCQKVQPGVKTYAGSLDDGVVFHHQLQQHFTRDYSGLSTTIRL